MVVIKGRDAERFLREMDKGVMTPERLEWLRSVSLESRKAAGMAYVYMVLQDGQPMQEAEKRGEHWALYFAGRNNGPTLWKARKWANNAIRRQKRCDKRHGFSLGR